MSLFLQFCSKVITLTKTKLDTKHFLNNLIIIKLFLKSQHEIKKKRM